MYTQTVPDPTRFTNSVTMSTLNVTEQYLSAGVSLFNILSSDGNAGINTLVTTSSGNWDTTYNTVSSLSAEWDTAYNTVFSLSAEWDTTYNTVSSLSSSWSEVYTSVNANSATWDGGIASVAAVSATWNDTSTTVETNSAAWVYENINADSSYYTLEEFTATNPQGIYKGYTVTLFDGRIYMFAGTDPSNANHYLEVNANPITPIYHEIPSYDLNTFTIDTYSINEFKSAKYTLQIETTFNNEIYYSEINVVGSIQAQVAIASEYGQISTSDVILGYQAEFDVNQIHLNMLFPSSLDPGDMLIVRGHRTNFFKI
jgi:hypothetical protein